MHRFMWRMERRTEWIDCVAQGDGLCRASAKGGDGANIPSSDRTQGRGNGIAGIVLRAADRLDNAYLVGLDYGAGTLRLERYRAVRAFHGSALDGERILCERPVPGLAAGDTDILVFLQDDILEVFVNGVTMTVPLRDIRGGGLGLYTSDGSAIFTLKS